MATECNEKALRDANTACWL